MTSLSEPCRAAVGFGGGLEVLSGSPTRSRGAFDPLA